MPDTVVTPEGLVVFEAVFQPFKRKGSRADQKAKYQMALAFPPGTNLDALKEIAKECAETEWGPKKVKEKKPRSPFITNYEHEALEGGGWVVIRPTSTRAPGVVDAKVQPILDPEEFHNGCWAKVSVHAFAWDDEQGGIGVSFGLNNVQKTRDGEYLSGGGERRKPEDDFQPVGEAAGGKKASSSDDLFS